MEKMRVNEICCCDTGSGDFFGPICVVACYIDNTDWPWLNELDIMNLDINDQQQIIAAGSILKDRLTYSLLLLDNSHYNKMTATGQKMTKIKTRLYNQAMINVMHKTQQPVDKKMIHGFLSPKKYYKNLKHQLLVVSHLTFMADEQGSIGMKCAKILSMYAHYQYFNNMNKALKITLPHGCNIKAIETGITLVNNYGVDILQRVCKKNWPNYQQILEKLQ